MAEPFTYQRGIWPGDVVFDPSAFKIIRQYVRYTYVTPDRHNKWQIERCFLNQVNIEIPYTSRYGQIAIKVKLATIATPDDTLRRVKIQLFQTFEQYFISEIAKFCAGREDRLGRCCRIPFRSIYLHHFLDNFLRESAINAGLQLLSVKYRSSAA